MAAAEAPASYDITTLARPLAERELPRSLLPLHHSFGFEFWRRNNLHFVAQDVLVSIVGNSVQLLGTTRCRVVVRVMRRHPTGLPDIVRRSTSY